MNTLINDRLKEIRQALNLTQAEFANGLGWSRGVVANFEAHITEPKELQIQLVGKVYGANIDYIMTGAGAMFAPKSIGEEMGEIAAAASKQNAEAVRQFFRELGDSFTDAEILFLYEIYKRHFGKN